MKGMKREKKRGKEKKDRRNEIKKETGRKR